MLKGLIKHKHWDLEAKCFAEDGLIMISGSNTKKSQGIMPDNHYYTPPWTKTSSKGLQQLQTLQVQDCWQSLSATLGTFIKS